MEELNTNETEKKTDKRLKNLRPPWKKGETSPNHGYPKGRKNFKTMFRLAVEALAKDTGRKPDDVNLAIFKTGVRQILKGNFNFYKDTVDRLFGKTPDIVNANVKTENIANIEEFKKYEGIANEFEEKLKTKIK